MHMRAETMLVLCERDAPELELAEASLCSRPGERADRRRSGAGLGKLISAGKARLMEAKSDLRWNR